MGGGRLLLGIAAALLLALVPSASAAAIPPELPDTDQFCFREEKPCGDPIVLGEPKWDSVPLLISGFSSGVGPCIDLSHAGGGTGSCGEFKPRHGEAISLTNLNYSVDHDGTTEYTEVFGPLRTDVAGVKVRYLTKGKSHTLDAFTYQVAGKVQKKLKSSKPFGFFEASVAGCVVGSHFRLTAFDAAGAKLGSTRVPDIKSNCRDPHPGTGGYIIFGARNAARPLPQRQIFGE